MQAGYTLTDQGYLERTRLDREAAQSLALGDADHARALAEQALGEALPIAARPVIPSNTFEVPNVNDTWRTALVIFGGVLLAVLGLLVLWRSGYLFRRVRRRL